MASTKFYIPSLDGIRAVAFLVVFVGHAQLGHLIPGGFGVTVFFFLSGFLITTLLRQEFEKTGAIDLKAFYLRRFLRIVPPLYLSLVVMMVATHWNLLHNPEPFSVPAVSSLFLFLSNYYTIFGPLTTSWPPGSGVMWSLAVEEHFYLLFPPLAYFLLRSVPVRRQVGLLAAFCMAALAWRCFLVYAWDVSEVRTMKATDTRLDSIVFGCMLALGCNPCLDPPHAVKPAVRWSILTGSLVLLLFCFVDRDVRFRETFRYSIQGFALLGLFYFAIVDHERIYFRWLNWGWVRFIGALSYSLYLIHFACQKVFETQLPNAHWAVMGLLALATSFLYALVLYYSVERPIARLRQRLHGKAPVPVAEKPFAAGLPATEALGEIC